MEARAAGARAEPAPRSTEAPRHPFALRPRRPRGLRRRRSRALLRRGLPQHAGPRAHAAHPGRPHALPRRGGALRAHGRTLGTRLPARRAAHLARRLVLRRTLRQRPLHAGHLDVRGLRAGHGLLPRGHGLHRRQGWLALRAARRPDVPSALSRTSDPEQQGAQLRGLRGRDPRRTGAHALRRSAVQGGRTRRLPLATPGVEARARLAARNEARRRQRAARSARCASASGEAMRDGELHGSGRQREQRAFPLRLSLLARLLLGQAERGLWRDVRPLRRRTTHGAPAWTALPLHQPRDGSRR